MTRQRLIILFGVVLIALVLLVVLLAVFLPSSCTITNTNSLQEQSQNFVRIITYKQLGLNGRFGNQMFQIASTLGFAKQHSGIVQLPLWSYSTMFEETDSFFIQKDLQNLETLSFRDIGERQCFSYSTFENFSNNVNINGYRQNSRYFNFIAHDLRRLFTFKSELFLRIKSMIKPMSIGVHVRRGDYVNHEVHFVCDKDYYLSCIQYFRNQFPTSQIVIISDDKNWCQTELMPNLSNAIISPFNSEQDDFICLSLCSLKIISNSTFAWWAAWLDARYDSQVIAPSPWVHQDDLSYNSIYLPEWNVYNTVNKSLKLSNSNIDFPIAAYYQCYKQPHAFVNACESFRRVYPTSSLVILSDDGDDFSKAAQHFGALSYSTNKTRGGNGVTTHISSFEQILTFLTNFITSARLFHEQYFILLEDDVTIVRAINIPSNIETDIIGNNSNVAKLPKFIRKYLKIDNLYYGGCGGSLFKTSFWANINLEKVYEQLKTFEELFVTANETLAFHTDIVLTFICYSNGGTICCGQDLFPTEFVQMVQVGMDFIPAVYHTYKELYNISPTNRELKLL